MAQVPNTPPPPGRMEPSSVHRAYNVGPSPIRFPSSSAPTPNRPTTPRHQKRSSPTHSTSSSLTRSPRPDRCHLPQTIGHHVSYETFPIPPPKTPWEERELPTALGDFLPRAVGSVLPVGMRSKDERRELGFGRADDEETGRRAAPETGPLMGSKATKGVVDARLEGVPKLTRQCFWSEFKCYGKYIASTILGIGLLTVIVILSIYSGRL